MPANPDPAEEMLARVREYEVAARTIADDETLSVRGRCLALLELGRRARREELPAFLEAGIWRGCRHFFEGDKKVPRDLIDANHRLLRRGFKDCPACRRPLPSKETLERWREISHDLRRPA